MMMQVLLWNVQIKWPFHSIQMMIMQNDKMHKRFPYILTEYVIILRSFSALNTPLDRRNVNYNLIETIARG